LQIIFVKNLIMLLEIKYIPPAELAELKENEELINYSILLF
jgi:hypothetical protein